MLHTARPCSIDVAENQPLPLRRTSTGVATRALAGAMGNTEVPFVGIWLQLNSYEGGMGRLSEFELWNEKGSSPKVENSAQLGA